MIHDGKYIIRCSPCKTWLKNNLRQRQTVFCGDKVFYKKRVSVISPFFPIITLYNFALPGWVVVIMVMTSPGAPQICKFHSCYCFSSSSQPSMVDLNKIIRRWAWDRFCQDRTWRQRNLKFNQIDFDIDWSKVTFHHSEPKDAPEHDNPTIPPNPDVKVTFCWFSRLYIMWFNVLCVIGVRGYYIHSDSLATTSSHHIKHQHKRVCRIDLL